MSHLDHNRLWNMKNPFQGDYKKVLCVCSAGLLRSPTAAWVLSNKPFNFNTRAAGLESEFALVVVDGCLLAWADEVVCMTEEHKKQLETITEKPVICLNVPDKFNYRDPELCKLISDSYKEKALWKK